MSLNSFCEEFAQQPAILELVETEKAFIETLKAIQHLFLKHLKPYLNSEDQEFIVILKVWYKI